MLTTREKLQRLCAAFTTENPRRVVTLSSAAPDGLLDVIRDEGHDGARALPCDWTYSAFRDACSALAEYGDPDEDTVVECADGLVDVYDHDRLAWMTAYHGAAEACDDARRDYPGGDTIETIGYAQCRVYQAICSALLRYVADLDEGDFDE